MSDLIFLLAIVILVAYILTRFSEKPSELDDENLELDPDLLPEPNPEPQNQLAELRSPRLPPIDFVISNPPVPKQILPEEDYAAALDIYYRDQPDQHEQMLRLLRRAAEGRNADALFLLGQMSRQHPDSGCCSIRRSNKPGWAMPRRNTCSPEYSARAKSLPQTQTRPGTIACWRPNRDMRRRNTHTAS